MMRTSDLYLKELAAARNLVDQEQADAVDTVRGEIGKSNLDHSTASELIEQATCAIEAATQLKGQLLAQIGEGAA